MDIGSHEVKIDALFFQNNQIPVLYKRNFLITVYENPKPLIDPDDKPKNGTFVPSWNDTIRENLIPEIVSDPETRPVPYIARLTETGLLTIGWDREMDPPVEFEMIPVTKIAIRDYSSFSSSEI